MTAVLVDRVRAAGEARVREVAQRIARDAPRLADLSPEELEALARAAVAADLRDGLRKAAALERIDYAGERAAFLRSRRSPGTARVYGRALARLEAWCEARELSVLELGPAEADDWIVGSKGDGRAPASVRLDVDAASAFFTWLERRHAQVRSPFRGTRARPPAQPSRRLEVPTPEEVATITASARGETRKAVLVLSKLGLRVGALPTLEVRGLRWRSYSKGRDISGELGEDLKRELGGSRPFWDRSADGIAHAVRDLTRRMAKAGEIRAVYSVHDLRHAFAVATYERTHDVYAVKQALHHASVAMTERYLRSLGVRA
jgi:site-specific recombinase XerD